MDAGVFVGHHRRTGRTYAPDEVLQRLERCGTRRAFATSFTAWQYDADEGNAETLSICANSDGRLLPLAVINPIAYVPSWRQLEKLAADGVRAIGIFDNEHGGALDEFVVRDIVAVAEELGLLLQVAINTRHDVTGIGKVVQSANLPVLLRPIGSCAYGMLSEAMAVAQNVPHVLLDVAFGVQNGGVELLAESIGSERLFVASNAPLDYEGCPYFQTLAAALTPEERQNILNRNLESLVGLEREDVVLPASMHELFERPKVDTLIHTGSCNVPNLQTPMAEISDELSASHTEQFVFSSLRGLFDDITPGLVETETYLAADPRAYGLLVLDPLRPEVTLEQIARHKDNNRVVGLKTIQDDGYDMPLGDERFDIFFDAIADTPDWSVLAHPTGLREAAVKHPGIRFICEHGTWAFKRMHDLPNVFFDIATSTRKRADTDIAELITWVGVDRVLYASDAPLMSPAFTLGKLWSLDLDSQTLHKVMFTNALAAFPRMAQEGTKRGAAE